jgi:hypothetical protein
MATAILADYISNDEEGIQIVDSFDYSDDVVPTFVEEVNAYIEKIFSDLVLFKNDNNGECPFYIIAESEFDENEQDEGEYIYSESRYADTHTTIPVDPWEAARAIVASIMETEYWKEMVEREYKPRVKVLNNTIADIPASTPPLPIEPVDPRFEKGDYVYDIHGRRFRYRGVLFDPLRKRVSSLADVSNTSNNIRIGIDNKEYANAKAVEEIVQNEDIEVYPLPLAYTRGMRKKTAPKFFARLEAYPDKEGIGQRVEDTKFKLALEILIERPR